MNSLTQLHSASPGLAHLAELKPSPSGSHPLTAASQITHLYYTGSHVWSPSSSSFEMAPSYVTQAGLELVTFLLHLPKG